MATNNGNMNGAHAPDVNGENRVAELLQDDITVGYKPQLPLEGMWAGGGDGMPQVTLRRDLEFMQLHPIVGISLEYYKSGIAGAEFWGGPIQDNPDDEKGKPISPNEKVSQFVLAHCERFWQRGIPMIQEDGYPYGWCPGEHIYKEASGYFVWSHLKTFHPNDGFVLTANHDPVGVRVKNVRDMPFVADGEQKSKGGTIDLWLASEAIPAKGLWYAHRPRFSNHYGRSQLTGAWLPWRMLGWRDGIDQIINAAVYRAGYKGPVVRHPQESSQTADSGVPGTQLDGRGMPRRDARDVARQMGEYAKAGATFTMPSTKYPATQGGDYKWSLEWPEHVMDVTPLIEAAKWCEARIMLGIGVPPELVQASETGSGYSGRSVPREAFLDGQQKVADALLQMFVEQVLRPLVLWNFGDIPFNVQVKSLLKTQAADKQGEEEKGQQKPGGMPGQQPPNQPPTPPQPTDNQPQQAMSLDSARRDKVIDIVKRVLHKRAS